MALKGRIAAVEKVETVDTVLGAVATLHDLAPALGEGPGRRLGNLGGPGDWC
jgi:hypothetical protein